MPLLLAAAPGAVDVPALLLVFVIVMVATRLFGDLRANTLADWVAGQSVGTPEQQGLVAVTDCSGGPASWAM